MQLFSQDNFLIAGVNGGKGDIGLALPRQPHHRLHAVEVPRALPRRCTTPRTRTREPRRRRWAATIPRSSSRSATSARASRGACRSRRGSTLALHLGLRFFNSVSSESVLGSATNFLARPHRVVRSAPRGGDGERAAALPHQLRLRARQLDRPAAGGAVRGLDHRRRLHPLARRRDLRLRDQSEPLQARRRRRRAAGVRAEQGRARSASSSITSTSPSATATRSSATPCAAPSPRRSRATASTGRASST